MLGVRRLGVVCAKCTPTRDLRIVPLVKKLILIAFASLIAAQWQASLHAQQPPSAAADTASKEACVRPSAGSAVPEPEDLRSRNGVLKVELAIRNTAEADGPARYCYIDGNGNQSPNLRLKPSDLLILRLKNDLTNADHGAAAPNDPHAHMEMSRDPCGSG